MRPTDILSLFLAFLTALTGLVTLCPGGEGDGFSVHFISETCDTHDCHQADDHSCRSDDCNHGVCGDVDIGTNYYPVQQYHYESIPAPCRFFVADYSACKSSMPGISSERHGGVVDLQRSSVLRI